MIKVNGKDLVWTTDITFSEILKQIGYTISNPRFIVRVNGTTVPKNERGDYKIADSAEIEIVNTLCGG